VLNLPHLRSVRHAHERRWAEHRAHSARYTISNQHRAHSARYTISNQFQKPGNGESKALAPFLPFSVSAGSQ
jgi:hypothetical protein